jgi:hypothetical protein
MRMIASSNGAAPAFTPEGTLTVLLCGAAAGAAGALVHALLDWKLSRHAWVRSALFALFLAFITARGLHPVERFPLMLFGPVVALYGMGLIILWPRVASRERVALATTT